MRLYTRNTAASVSDETHGSFDVDENGAIEVPEELGQRLHATHVAGQPQWETEAERHQRLTHEELERRRDPETLLQAVEHLGRHSGPDRAPIDEEALAKQVQDAVDAALAKQRAEFEKQLADAQTAKADAEAAKADADAALEAATAPEGTTDTAAKPAAKSSAKQ